MEFGMRYFTLEQREALQQWLENRANTLRAELRSDLKEDLGKEPELAATQRDADELRDVETALARLHEPDFGRCTGCGGDIPYQRLRANPAALLCLGCQERQELRRDVFEAETKGVPVKVNAAYPEAKELMEMPPSLLLALPQLPKQIRYRFVGTNLLLVDRESNLILDYMTNALP